MGQHFSSIFYNPSKKVANTSAETASDCWYGFVNRQLFPLTDIEPDYTADAFPPRQLAFVPRPDGDGHVVALFVPSSVPTNKCIMYFHGNGVDLHGSHHVLTHMAETFKAHVVAMEFPSYGLSKTGGRASEKRVNRDADILYKFVTEVWKMEPRDLIVVGRSIGTGAAARLAASRDVGGLVLVSPYTSIRDIVAYYVGSVPASFVSNRFEIRETVQKCTTRKILIVHGTMDTTIPTYMGTEVHSHSNSTIPIVLLPAGHNNIYIHMDRIRDKFLTAFSDGRPVSRTTPEKDLPDYIFRVADADCDSPVS